MSVYLSAKKRVSKFPQISNCACRSGSCLWASLCARSHDGALSLIFLPQWKHMQLRMAQDLIKLANGVKVSDCQSGCLSVPCDGLAACRSSFLMPYAKPTGDPEALTSNQYKLTSLAELHKVLVWRDSCLLRYFLQSWQITGALQISADQS